MFCVHLFFFYVDSISKQSSPVWLDLSVGDKVFVSCHLEEFWPHSVVVSHNKTFPTGRRCALLAVLSVYGFVLDHDGEARRQNNVCLYGQHFCAILHPWCVTKSLV
jgi:hypothetical protein